MEKILKKAGWTSVIAAIIYIALGIVLMMNPTTALDIVAIITGIVFLAIGIIKVVDYFVLQGNYDFYNYELIHGLVAFVIGIIILAYARQVASIFVVLVGIWITYSGLMNLTLSMKLGAAKINTWVIVFVLSVIMMVGGIYVIVAPEAMIVLVGAFMVGYAIIELIENFIFIKNAIYALHGLDFVISKTHSYWEP